ncbi:neprosin family prolyl endopeptidase [Streptomyces sp. NPDC051105]|uniref:neprosin family prolyl endopeptidase n=1 Tax=Streptomyces sp. NPDC051105 TaxID=3154843 RepID=UPI003448D774
MTATVSPHPFNEFLESVASARYEEVRQFPGAAVESASAFEEMKAYVIDLYRGVNAVESFVETDGQVIDCVPEDRHPAAQRWGGLAAAPAEGPPQVAEAGEPTPPDPRSREIVHPRPQDPETARAFPAGTTPLYRTTLSRLCQFPNLAAFSGKNHLIERTAPDTVELGGEPYPKRYATGEQNIKSLGGSSKVNVWSPFAGGGQSTFSQQWYYAGQEGTLLQTVECGWHIDISRYGNATPHLFVFATRESYHTGHSFYNLEGGAFLPVANPYVTPGAPLLVSQQGGTQVEYKMGFYLTNNAWWFYFDDHPIGCYPVSWFNNGPLTTGATRAKFGGEAGSILSTWPPMGSGLHAREGFRKAAYQRAAAVNPVTGGAVYATLSEAGSVFGPCYSVQITNNTASDWGTYLFFGGPGGNGC